MPLSVHYKWKEIIDIVWKTINEKLNGTNFRQKVPLSQRVTLIYSTNGILRSYIWTSCCHVDTRNELQELLKTR